jgi:UDP-N-acetylmuramate dehydrogenase
MEIHNIFLRDYTSLHIGGRADMVVVKSVEALQEAIRYVRQEGKRIHVLGGGTNTYFDERVENIFVIKNEIMGIEVKKHDIQTDRLLDKDNPILVTVGAGEVWDDVVVYAVENGLWGIENLSYIPGTVGAAPVQNIGAYGSELKDVFVSLVAVNNETLEVVELSKEECQFGYRDSLFKHKPDVYSICTITISLSKLPLPVLTYKPLDILSEKTNLTIQDVRDLVVATRTAKLPDWKEHPNAGSFFKNPIVSKEVGEELQRTYPSIPLHLVEAGYKIPAAWLIEHIAKMKGVRMGEVGTWPQQPLVIVNFGQAEAKDVNSLAEKIIEKVNENTGVTLEKEVNFIS